MDHRDGRFGEFVDAGVGTLDGGVVDHCGVHRGALALWRHVPLRERRADGVHSPCFALTVVSPRRRVTDLPDARSMRPIITRVASASAGSGPRAHGSRDPR